MTRRYSLVFKRCGHGRSSTTLATWNSSPSGQQLVGELLIIHQLRLVIRSALRGTTSVSVVS